jgi:dipeptidyl aminopeptidase/acylaminoacyl peptidase
MSATAARLLRAAPLASALAVAGVLAVTGTRVGSQGAPQLRRPPAPATEPLDEGRPDFARMLQMQAQTDRTWRTASAGYMQMDKITFPSAAGDLEIPAFVFQPLQSTGPRSRPAIVWVHENIRGHLYEHYIPYIREATSRGFVVIAPEYRGSIGYGRKFYDAIDYGGAEVSDVTAAAAALTSRYPQVDPARVGIIGWSHGGLITLLAVLRRPTLFHAAAAMEPVTNLLHRLARKGIERQRRAIDPQNRFGGPPSERPDVYIQRSPLFHVDRLRIPLLLHVAENDQDVNFDEAIQLVDALRARKSSLADIKIYPNPPGGHTFDRMVLPNTWQPLNTADQVDSWKRVWQFFDRQLNPIN